MSGRSSRCVKRDSSRRRHSRSPERRTHSHRVSHGRRCDDSRNNRKSPSNQALDTILVRLNAIEDRLSSTKSISEPSRPTRGCHTPSLPVTVTPPVETVRDSTNEIVTALTSLITKPSQYYISNFDPNVNDFDIWCAEVDQGREINRWDDRECLSRIGRCLKGDARTWLDDWVSNDRSWTNFKSEFRSLCPRRVDIANILFDVMKTDSNNFTTYSEYARKSLLRLNIVKGLSNDLKTAIIIRGITDPQVKAIVSNAKLQHNELVEFLSVYTKPQVDLRHNRNLICTTNASHSESRKHRVPRSNVKCYKCGDIGHLKSYCSKRQRTECSKFNTASTESNKKVLSCTFCKKVGHTVEKCFAKSRVESKGQDRSNVNFCQTTNDAKTL